MSLTAAVLLGVAALIVLVISAEKAIDRVTLILDRFQLSATFGGLTIFSLLTSLPELLAHLVASAGILSGRLDYDIASATVLGGNIGSDIVQQTLILGLVVLLTGGMTFEKDFLFTAYLPMILTTLMCLVLGWDRVYGRIDGAILVLSFVAYMVFLARREVERARPEPSEAGGGSLWLAGILALALFALILGSAHVLLIAVEAVVKQTGLGGSLVGVVSLGLASAAPEFITALAGLKKGKAGISLGTLIGSNITNPLVAIGGGALLSTYSVPGPLIILDLPMETITAALLLGYLLVKPERYRLGRAGGVYLMVLYVAYLVVRFVFFAQDS